MKAITLSAVTLSQFVAGDAGSASAVYENRLSAVYGAALCIIKDNNDTQFKLVQAACETYATKKACRALTDTPDKDSAAAGRAHKTYGAYALALKEMGFPTLHKTPDINVRTAEGKAARLAACAPLAEEYALQFVNLLTAALTPPPKAEKTQEEKDAAAAEAEQAKRDAEAAEEQAAIDRGLEDARLAEEQAAHIKAEAEKLAAKMAKPAPAPAPAPAPTLEEMARSVEMAILANTLDEETQKSLFAALAAKFTVQEMAEA